MKSSIDVVVPLGPTSVIGPVVAPFGTLVRMVMSDFTENFVGTPLNNTSLTPVKLSPMMVTALPRRPPPGQNPMSNDGGWMVHVPGLAAMLSDAVSMGDDTDCGNLTA